jgi:hypothetical protein
MSSNNQVNKSQQVNPITTIFGATISRIDPEHTHIDFSNISSVGLENICDVEAHFINNVLGSTSHLIKFRNGGEVNFAYNTKGQLVDFFAKNVKLLFDQNHKIIFSIAR